MDIRQGRWTEAEGWTGMPGDPDEGVDLVLLFGGREALLDPARCEEVRSMFPQAHLAGCSTAGEIQGTSVQDDSIALTGLSFADSRAEVARWDLEDDGADPEDIGRRLAAGLPTEGLVHVLVFSEGTRVNGTALVAGMTKALPVGVQITGGLAGDGDRFEKTVVVSDAGPSDEAVVAVGLYGDQLRIGYGSLGGWDSFGPARKVTRSANNILYELDGQPALSLYKEYLGDQAEGLPATGLLFPLSVRFPGHDGEVVRTILGVDDGDQSMTFAGDVPEGATARLMKANFDRLVDGAHDAAVNSQEPLGDSRPELALLISCIGRRLVLKQRIEEELDAVQEVIGEQAAMTGFYSYGEICPSAPGASCELHNQTMTITTLREG